MTGVLFFLKNDHMSIEITGNDALVIYENGHISLISMRGRDLRVTFHEIYLPSKYDVIIIPIATCDQYEIKNIT